VHTKVVEGYGHDTGYTDGNNFPATILLTMSLRPKSNLIKLFGDTPMVNPMALVHDTVLGFIEDDEALTRGVAIAF